MKFQKSAFSLLFTLFFASGVSFSNDHILPTTDPCKLLEQLNHTMTVKLGLTEKQLENVLELNERFWRARKKIMDTPEMIGQNTALLSCWFEWKITLDKHLTESQIKRFMQWQSEVNLLGSIPY